jgi:TatD DNase family protein
MRGDVEADIRSVLEARSDVLCVFHSFDGSPELCRWILDRGWMIGAGGLMSRRSAKSLRASLAATPMDQLLLETDSPYLAPTGWSEKRNSPESIPVIAAHVARLLDRPIAEVARKTSENAQRVFSLELHAGIALAPLMGGE